MSSGNDLPVLVCDYCHDFILKFYVFYEFVKENQERLSLEVPPKKEDVPSVVSTDRQKTPPPVRRRKLKKKQLNLPSSVIKDLKSGLPPSPSLVQTLASSRLFLCDHCDNYYSLHAKVLLVHVKRCKNKQSSEAELVVACPLCQPRAPKMRNDQVLQLHLREHERLSRIDESRIRTGQTPLLPCPDCERRFSSKLNLETHMRNHVKDAFMTCEVCGRTVVASSLTAHLLSHSKKFFCEFCSLACTTKHDLQKHVRRRHAAPESYECSYCKSPFKTKGRLEKHITFCRGPGTIRPCPHCGKLFDEYNQRKIHIRQEHIGFRCRICALEFINVSRFNRHMRTSEHLGKSEEKRLERGKGPKSS